jgi:hypothetical protein
MSTITNFKAQLLGGGARTNLFSVLLSFPNDVTGGFFASQRAEYLVKAAALPASTVTPIEVPYRGRILKVAGDRTFEPWTVTVLNDTGMEIRNAFEDWMHRVTRHEGNTSAFGNNLDYMATASISQLDREGNAGKTYTMVDVWPSSVSAIDLTSEAGGIQEFQVTLEYQYWVSDTTVA